MDCIAPKYIWPHRSVDWCDQNVENPVLVDCGKCLPCLSNKRNDWSFRLEQEYKNSSSALFITLTYDQKHLRTDNSLDKRDLQLFMKRLRKRSSEKLRYYAVGEYGSKTGRPHYHVLLFNGEEKNVTEAWKDSKGNPIGIVHFGKVTEASVAYVTKYIIQKEDHEDKRQKPFALMSRKYGIGGKYLTDAMIAWHKEDDRNYAIRNGQKIKLPRFYKEKIFYGIDKEILSVKSKQHRIKKLQKEEQILRKRFGSQWVEKKREAINEMVSRIKVKISYTQKF